MHAAARGILGVRLDAGDSNRVADRTSNEAGHADLLYCGWHGRWRTQLHADGLGEGRQRGQRGGDGLAVQGEHQVARRQEVQEVHAHACAAARVQHLRSTPPCAQWAEAPLPWQSICRDSTSPPQLPLSHWSKTLAQLCSLRHLATCADVSRHQRRSTQQVADGRSSRKILFPAAVSAHLRMPLAKNGRSLLQRCRGIQQTG